MRPLVPAPLQSANSYLLFGMIMVLTIMAPRPSDYPYPNHLEKQLKVTSMQSHKYSSWYSLLGHHLSSVLALLCFLFFIFSRSSVFFLPTQSQFHIHCRSRYSLLCAEHTGVATVIVNQDYDRFLSCDSLIYPILQRQLGI